MSQRFFFLILFFILKISVQLDCSSLSGATCGGHNTKYNLMCHKFGTGSCTEVEYDDGCTVDGNHNCVKTDTSSTSYQCYFYSLDNSKCKRINIDSGCKVTISSGIPQCQKDNVQDDEDCFLSSDMKACEKKKKACNLYSNDNCGGLAEIKDKKQCARLYTGYCKEVTIDDNCKIDATTGRCAPKSTIDSKNICKMNTEETSCTLKTRECSEYGTDSCSTHGSTCKKVKIQQSLFYTELKCKIINSINENCEINNDGECATKSGKTIGDHQKCAYNSEYTACELTNKQCSEITNTGKCTDSKITQNGCICSKVKGHGNCLNVEINDACNIDTNGDCVLKNSDDKGKCQYIQQNSTYSKCVYYNADSQCTLENYYTCKDGSNLASNKICDFKVISNTNTKCEPRDKICGDYTSEETCNVVENCYFADGKCYKILTDNNCEVKSINECSKKSTASLNEDDEKCDYIEDEENIRCEKRNKYCSEYKEEAKCNKAPGYDGVKCFYKSGTCKKYYPNEYCSLNSKGECEGSGKLSTNEKCVLYYDTDEIYCQKVEKKCEDYTSNNCDNYTPEAKLCFNIKGPGYNCQEVKVDSQCTMNEDNECTGNNCQFDEKKDRCYYQEKSNGSLLKMKQFILLMLFFTF